MGQKQVNPTRLKEYCHNLVVSKFATTVEDSNRHRIDILSILRRSSVENETIYWRYTLSNIKPKHTTTNALHIKAWLGVENCRRYVNI